MDLFAEVNHLYVLGRYREALNVFSGVNELRLSKQTQLLKAELLGLVGDCESAEQVVGRLIATKGLTDTEASHLCYIRARIAAEIGDAENQVLHLQKSIALAERAGDVRRTCLAQLRLLGFVADRDGVNSASVLLGSVRRNVNAVGDPIVSAALHLVVAELDGKRGLIEKLQQRIAIADQIIRDAPNAWLESWLHNTRLALSILHGDLEQAQFEAPQCLALSATSGRASTLRSAFGNVGRMHLALGNLENALTYFHQAIDHSPHGNEHEHTGFESVARVYQAQGHFEESLALLLQIDDAYRSATRSGRYVHRHSLLTQSEILLRLERPEESDACLQRVLSLSRQSGDQVPIAAYASLLHAEVLLRLGRHDAAWQTLTSIVPSLSQQPFDVFALYERVVACALLHAGDRESAGRHFERSRRIYENLQNKPAVIELSRSWHSAETLVPAERVSNSAPPERHATNVLQNLAAMMLHHGKPDLLALDLVSLLSDAACVVSAEAVVLDQTGISRPLAAFGLADAGADTRTLSLGTSRNRTVTVTVQPKRDLESQAVLNSVTLLLGTVRELELARAEREERLTLWPADEFGETLSGAVVGGKMRELLAYAKRIAQTNIGVLITGESGTGKEVLARAIHNFSPRARKPFVPFNCTAVPRELLESQMFGYRRGAFTGAERDHAGVIRSAKDGTLFLDEVGELGLDLQPKLLRFLESGEINPLGEPSPFHVDVRIVAATNANLDQLVLDGKFREDLFYRLNVLPLLVPPLRERRDEIPGLVDYFVTRAAAEFKKGRIRVADDTRELLILYSWPGNIRQLQNEVRRMVALMDADSVLRPSALSKALRGGARHAPRNQGLEITVPLNEKLNPTLARIEKEMIKTALKAADGKVEVAARALGISRKGLYLKRQRLGL